MSYQTDKTLTYPVNVNTLPTNGLKVTLDPDASELSEIADQAGVLSIDRFNSELVVKRWRRNGVTIFGKINAEITQECVVSLEPVNSKISEEIERTFLPEGSKLTKPKLSSDGEIILDYEGKDEPDIFVGDTIDIWEVVMENVLLAIDPFPRSPLLPDKEFSVDTDKGKVQDKVSPFAALKGLIKP